MLKRFAFRAKMLYLCTSEEEKARKHWAFSSFFAQYKGCNTKHLGISRCFSGNFLGFIGNFLGFIGVNESPMWDLFAAEIIKDIKVFRAKKVGF